MTMVSRRPNRQPMPADVRARRERARADFDFDRLARQLRELDPAHPQLARGPLYPRPPAPRQFKYRGRITLALVGVLLVANFLLAIRAVR